MTAAPAAACSGGLGVMRPISGNSKTGMLYSGPLITPPIGRPEFTMFLHSSYESEETRVAFIAYLFFSVLSFSSALNILSLGKVPPWLSVPTQPRVCMKGRKECSCCACRGAALSGIADVWRREKSSIRDNDNRGRGGHRQMIHKQRKYYLWTAL